MNSQEIFDKTFSRSFKGYTDTEVDIFLQKIAEEYASMEKKLAEYVSMDREISEALLSAQKAARSIIDSAKDDEKKILEEAEEALATIKQEIVDSRAYLDSETKKTNDTIDRQALDLRIKHALKIDEMRREVYELSTLRDSLTRDIKAMLDVNIQSLQSQLDSINSRGDNGLQKRVKEKNINCKLEYAPYAIEDINAEEITSELPKLSFEE